MRLNAKTLKISVMSSKINKDQPCVKMDEKSIALNILGYDCCSNPNKKLWTKHPGDSWESPKAHLN